MEIGLRIPESWRDVIEAYARENNVDEKTALRMLTYEGIRKYVLKLYSSGEVSLSKAAEILGVSVHDVLRLAVKYGVEVGPTKEQAESGEKWAEKLLK